jgi:hypothetical protein
MSIARASMHTEDKAVLPAVIHGTASIGGLNIAYREAGDLKSPKVVLLHGWPASSHSIAILCRLLRVGFM